MSDHTPLPGEMDGVQPLVGAAAEAGSCSEDLGRGSVMAGDPPAHGCSDSACLDGQPQEADMRQSSEDPFLVGVPAVAERDPLFAGDQVHAEPESLLSKLSQLAAENQALRRRIEEQDAQLDDFADQVIQDLEERSWFEELTSLEVCDVTATVEEIAGRLLGRLREVMQAEAVGFASLDRVSREPDGDVIWFGEPPVPPGTVVEIVETYRSQALGRPVVKNWTGTPPFAGVQSLILCSLARGAACAGWLLAINRSTAGSVPPARGFLESDFSSSEARLLQATAVAMATHSHSLELFRCNKDMALGAIQSLAGAVDAKDSYTRGHSGRVGQMASQLGRRLSLDQRRQEQLMMTGLLHDIGKIGIPDAVLQKTGRLSQSEFEILKQHPQIGHRILKPIEPLAYALPGVLHHHESFDGRGYPWGLRGSEIPLDGRILAVVDAYDAMTSNRPYRDGMPFDVAEQVLREGAGAQWDPELVSAFLAETRDFREICARPPGSDDATEEPYGAASHEGTSQRGIE